MAKKHFIVARDDKGSVIPLTACFVYLNGTTTLASLFDSELEVGPLPNPVFADAQGQIEFWINPGLYTVVLQRPPYQDADIYSTEDDIELGNSWMVQVGGHPDTGSSSSMVGAVVPGAPPGMRMLIDSAFFFAHTLTGGSVPFTDVDFNITLNHYRAGVVLDSDVLNIAAGSYDVLYPFALSTLDGDEVQPGDIFHCEHDQSPNQDRNAFQVLLRVQK